MERCPVCKNQTVEISYHNFNKPECKNDGCTYRVENEEKGTYSTIRYKPKENIGQRVEFDKEGVEIRVINEWSLLLPQFVGMR